MLMSLGEEFNIIEIDRLLELPQAQVYTWIEYFRLKKIRSEEARERAINEAKNRRS